ncbi:hypothetical protein [Sporosalibacterium faouarense]|uniref:hypothetical protein n=1 Tax=Sporosalibacterium faouarense TaxID=516123 RepID=UPI00141D4F39|nr:hypothetical protein [Sporosalibacterium faouarense]MTI48283.1 hypothetical protein [Bacillota bacterium]
MAEIKANDFGSMFYNIMYDDSMVDQFDEFSEKYGNASDAELYTEIEKVQAEVSNEVKKKHIENLELIAKMDSIVPTETIRGIQEAKRLVKIDETSSNAKKISDRELRRQYVSPTSLLLWFLLLTVIWRGRRYYRRTLFGPFRRF